MVNPGGTGRPALVISASPEPLPPSVSFIVRLPSAFPLPKKYTYFELFVVRGADFFAAVFVFFTAFAIGFSSNRGSERGIRKITQIPERFRRRPRAPGSAFRDASSAAIARG